MFTLAYLLPLLFAHLPQQKKTTFRLAILYNKSIAHPSFLLEEAILFCIVDTVQLSLIGRAHARGDPWSEVTTG